jgi:arabinose-5-phosphate isomerase
VTRKFWEVVNAETDAVGNFSTDAPSLLRALQLLNTVVGHVVVIGVGKAGLIGRKISATLSSTGTPSFFLHPTEAMHGDLGMVGHTDVVLVLSNSGTTAELVRLAPHLKKIGCSIVLVTGAKDTELSKMCDAVICYGKHGEADAYDLAPSISTTLMLVIGDALALSVMNAKKFGADDFARFHPGGALGGKAITADAVMRTGPITSPVEDSPQQAAAKMAYRHRGLSIVVEDGKVVGVVTIASALRAVPSQTLHGVFTPLNLAVVAKPETTVAELMRLMRERRVNQIPVLGPLNEPLGIVDIQDIVGLRLDGV